MTVFSLVLITAVTVTVSGNGEVSDSLVEESLRLAGENAQELSRFLNEVPDSLIQDARFLVANMPYRDLGAITADLLLENIRTANAARENLPWGHTIPVDIYRHFVLPHRMTQERLVSWRPYLFQELIGVVSCCTTMTDAAVTVNRWLDDAIDFKPSERRDQDPITTIRRGIGRCEEMAIAYIAAARSVCIPARSCWTPWWALSDNNHAWVEVWVDGEWHYTGAAEARPELDDAWFTGPATYAAAVYSSTFGRRNDSPEAVYRHGDRYTIINSTDVYTTPRTIRVSVKKPDASVVSGASVWVHVFNFGWYMSVASGETDDAGSISFVLGPGQYVITGGDDDLGFLEHADILHAEIDTVRAILSEPLVSPGFEWLKYIP